MDGRDSDASEEPQLLHHLGVDVDAGAVHLVVLPPARVHRAVRPRVDALAIEAIPLELALQERRSART